MSEEGTPPPPPEGNAGPVGSASPPPPASQPQMSGGMNQNTWAMLVHLSALSGYIVPFGNILGPLIIWLVKKDTMPSIDRHGKEALNFQISLFIFVMVGAILSFILMLVVIGFVTIFVVLIGWMLLGLICPIVAGIKANDGGWYDYPLTIRFIK